MAMETFQDGVSAQRQTRGPKPVSTGRLPNEVDRFQWRLRSTEWRLNQKEPEHSGWGELRPPRGSKGTSAYEGACYWVRVMGFDTTGRAILVTVQP